MDEFDPAHPNAHIEDKGVDLLAQRIENPGPTLQPLEDVAEEFGVNLDEPDEVNPEQRRAAALNAALTLNPENVVDLINISKMIDDYLSGGGAPGPGHPL